MMLHTPFTLESLGWFSSVLFMALFFIMLLRLAERDNTIIFTTGLTGSFAFFGTIVDSGYVVPIVLCSMFIIMLRTTRRRYAILMGGIVGFLVKQLIVML